MKNQKKAVWRKLAATAIALCLVVGFALPRDAHAAMPVWPGPAVKVDLSATGAPPTSHAALPQSRVARSLPGLSATALKPRSTSETLLRPTINFP
ncbi:DUF3693 domain-containing protein [Stenotrophomonas sp. TWI700]|uniref:DUF3693 domain-containing protein n=1 Tax=Stenotrophomonas sp. TWI700 TaxID=3136792 RepID=UPI00320B432C